ncbi:retrovirus-related Pol polyprotein from type-1 retrotransposable element R2 [Trichonephila clavata]|uniref:Retrovirus-related Pol polyprotein from type-1 retrotransposable element R2 n=1 Tax=Trichonephila clavata TaxID=2740835 RepID=A0A8X6F7B3_TRICU|nr:retrovirus-related Pol polyprotein from type-1 retrotransposable element R2 [Trichonephila clavata]
MINVLASNISRDKGAQRMKKKEKDLYHEALLDETTSSPIERDGLLCANDQVIFCLTEAFLAFVQTLTRRLVVRLNHQGCCVFQRQDPLQKPSRRWGLRPDLVAEVGDKLFVLDVTIPFENRGPAFNQAWLRKVEKYKPLLDFFHKIGRKKISIIPIVVGSLGAWDPENDSFLRKVATKSYLNVLRKLCVSDCIRWSRDIYIQHLTGVQQYGKNTIVPPQIAGIEEQLSDQDSDRESTAISQSSPCSEPHKTFFLSSTVKSL